MHLSQSARRGARQTEFNSPIQSVTAVDSIVPITRRTSTFGEPRLSDRRGAWSRHYLPRSLWVGTWSRTIDTIVALTVLVSIVIYSKAPDGLEQLSDVFAIRVSLKNAVLLGLFVLVWPAALTAVGSYRDDDSASFTAVSLRVALGCAIGSLVALVIVITSGTGLLGLPTVLIFWIGAVVATLVVRLCTRMVVWLGRARARPHRLIIAGTGARAAMLWEQLRHHPRVRYELVATVDVPGADIAPSLTGWPTIPIDQMETFCMNTVIDELVVALPVKSCYQQIETVLQTCERTGVRSLYLADSFSPIIGRAQVTRSGGYSVVSIDVVHDDWRLLVKRWFDFVAALVLLVLLSPLFLAITIAIKATSPGPVFFAQERFGYRKRRFRMYKFRTMVSDAERLQAALEDMNEASGPVFKIRQDPRITPIGRMLRRTSLDELPQLWNVLVGEMSFVGPRPLAVRDVGRFNEAWLMRRFSVLPGLTCLWQIGGRSNLSFDEWMRLDLEYIDNWSLMLDARILLMTVPAVLSATGAA